MEEFNDIYETINLLINKELELRPRLKVLSISKIFGEFFPSNRINHFDRLDIDDYSILEPNLEENIQIYKAKTSRLESTKILTFEEFQKLFNNISLTNYDIVICDTVHYFEIGNYILQNIIPKLRTGTYYITHDVLPQEEHLSYIFDKRNTNCLWVGNTFMCFYNFYINNKSNTYIIKDRFTGYGVIKINSPNVDYIPLFITLSEIYVHSILHNNFIKLI